MKRPTTKAAPVESRLVTRDLLERIADEADQGSNADLHRNVSYLATSTPAEVIQGILALESLLDGARRWAVRANEAEGALRPDVHHLRATLKCLRNNLAVTGELLDVVLAATSTKRKGGTR